MPELHGIIYPGRLITTEVPCCFRSALPFRRRRSPYRTLNVVVAWCTVAPSVQLSVPALHQILRPSNHPEGEKRLSALYEEQNREVKSPPQSDILKLADGFVDWGFTQEEISRFAPLLLNEDRTEVLFLLDVLIHAGFTQLQIKSMVRRYPKLVRLDPEVVEMQRQYFAETLEMNAKEFVKLGMRWPRTLSFHPYKRLKPICDYFMIDLGFGAEHLRKILARFPQILSYSLEGKLIPLVDYFLSEIGVPKELFANKIKQHPSVFGRSPDGIKKQVEWMRENLEYTDADLVKHCSRCTGMFKHGLPNVEAKIDNICHLFRLERRESRPLILCFPRILTMSIQNVSNSFHYITKVMRGDVEELRRCPSMLSLSVENRLRLRYERMESDLFPRESYAMITLYGSTDVQFERLLKRHASKHNPPRATS